MYKELEKFKVTNSFLFSPEDSLEQVCNASEGCGVFLVYDLTTAKELIMVGSTGTVQNNGTLKIKNGGLSDKIVEGHQFAKTGRKYSRKLLSSGFEEVLVLPCSTLLQAKCFAVAIVFRYFESFPCIPLI